MDSKPLHFLASQADSFRDSQWEMDFLDALVAGSIELIHDEPKMGPDHWPYMFVKTSANATEPSRHLIYWLTENGVGLAINPHKTSPDYVFSYGMLWNFRENAQFLTLTTSSEPFETFEAATAPQELLLSDPNTSILPQYARSILRSFFNDQGFSQVKIAHWQNSPSGKINISIYLPSLGNPPAAEHEGISRAISWFLPNHYNISLINEDPNFNFFDL